MDLVSIKKRWNRGFERQWTETQTVITETETKKWTEQFGKHGFIVGSDYNDFSQFPPSLPTNRNPLQYLPEPYLL